MNGSNFANNKIQNKNTTKDEEDYLIPERNISESDRIFVQTNFGYSNPFKKEVGHVKTGSMQNNSSHSEIDASNKTDQLTFTTNNQIQTQVT